MTCCTNWTTTPSDGASVPAPSCAPQPPPVRRSSRACVGLRHRRRGRLPSPPGTAPGSRCLPPTAGGDTPRPCSPLTGDRDEAIALCAGAASTAAALGARPLLASIEQAAHVPACRPSAPSPSRRLLRPATASSASPPRARGSRAARPRLDQQADRRDVVHQREDCTCTCPPARQAGGADAAPQSTSPTATGCSMVDAEPSWVLVGGVRA